MVVYKYRVLVI